jgi:hypothetical protein
MASLGFILCKVDLDVKWDQMICKNLRLHAPKIGIRDGAARSQMQ